MRQCSYFVPTQRFSERCGCGKEKSKHSEEVLERSQTGKGHLPTHLTLPGIQEVDTTDADVEGNEVGGVSEWGVTDYFGFWNFTKIIHFMENRWETRVLLSH